MAGQITEQELGSTKINDTFVNVGSNADAASATGSVHGKLKDIKQSLGASQQIDNQIRQFYSAAPYNTGPVGSKATNGSAINNTRFVVTEVTGSGVLQYAFIQGTNINSEKPEFSYCLRVTIDGVVFFAGYQQISGYGQGVLGFVVYEDHFLAVNNSNRTNIHKLSGANLPSPPDYRHDVTTQLPTNYNGLRGYLKPIEFKKSLKIEAYQDQLYADNTGQADLITGYRLT